MHTLPWSARGIFIITVALLTLSAFAPLTTRAATLAEQTDTSTLGETEAAHVGIGLPVQTLGTGLSGAAGSIAYKLNGATLADDVALGWGEVFLYSCPSASYSGCTERASSGYTPQVLSQDGDDAIILVNWTGSGYTFDSSLYYYTLFVTDHDLAVYGSAADTYTAGIGAWLNGLTFEADANTADIAFRICDTAVCDLTPTPPPPPPADTTAPILAEVTAVASGTSTTPSYAFSSTEAGTIAYGGSCASATTVAATGTNAVVFNALAVGTYSDCTVTVTDAAGNPSAPLAVSAFSVVQPVGSLMLTLTATGGDATFSLQGDGGIGAFTVTTLGGLGTYQVETLPTGTYHITQTLPTGWTESANDCAIVTVVEGEVANCTVANLKPTSGGTGGTKGNLIGFVFYDKDGDGRLDKKEWSLTGGYGQKVYLDTDNDGARDSGEPTFTTTIFGIYYFRNLTPGTYTVRLAPKSGSIVTTPSSAGLNATVTAGHTRFAGYFGFK